MGARKYRYFVGDFETTVYEGQVDTEVWASACVEMYTEDVKIFHSIDGQFEYLKSLKSDIVIYYHNLKFDGEFWLSYLKRLGFKESIDKIGAGEYDYKWKTRGEMQNGEMQYTISSLGQWYRILIKVNGRIIDIRDSLKLLPFSVEKLGNSFGTKHKKLSMVYTGKRFAGCDITDAEKEYIANDVLVVKEALEIMYNEGHKKLTIGSCCLSEYRKIINGKRYERLFPDVYDIEIDKDIYGCDNAGEYINNSYRGGWCYVVKGKENRIFHNGLTLDVNSLYPSMMHSMSGNRYPVGKPIFWHGNVIPQAAMESDKYFFVRLSTQFYIKPGMLPFIQLKNTLRYNVTEQLETSDIYDKVSGRYYDKYRDFNGNIVTAKVLLTLTMTDFFLLLEHYDLVNCKILDGCYFNSAIGLFDEYIDKYKQIKMRETGAKRELAKLFLNNLYGKMASNKNSSFKLAELELDGEMKYFDILENNKKPGYIPVGSAITSYARNFTIRAAQKNYYGKNSRGFIYADTDSIHCDLDIRDISGIHLDDKEFNCWKLESEWDIGKFLRQKSYMEHIIKENGEMIDKPYYNIKCAGMPKNCKDLFLSSMGEKDVDRSKLTLEELDFLETQRTIDDFKVGLTVPGKLIPKHMPGGITLMPVTYCIR